MCKHDIDRDKQLKYKSKKILNNKDTMVKKLNGIFQ